MQVLDSRDVLVTGIGTVTSLGAQWSSAFDKIALGTQDSGWTPWESGLFPPAPGCQLGIVKEYPIDRFFTAKQSRTMDKAMGMACVATGLALQDAGLDRGSGERMDGTEIATIFGSTRGEMSSLFRFGMNVLAQSGGAVNPALFPTVARNVACGQAAIRFELSGWSSMLSSGALAGMHALIRGKQLIQAGRADVVVVGAFESLSKITLHIFKGVYAAVAWDKEPDYFGEQGGRLIPAEGAGVIILESRSHAERRGAQPYAALGVAKFGSVGSASSHSFVDAIAHSRAADTNFIVTSQSGANTRADQLERTAIRHLASLDERETYTFTPKSIFGELESVSSILGVAVAASSIRSKSVPARVTPVLGSINLQEDLSGRRAGTSSAVVTGADQDGKFAVISVHSAASGQQVEQ